jgi:hypothetical protein
VVVRSGKRENRERRTDRDRGWSRGVTQSRWRRQGLGDSRVEKMEGVGLFGEKNKGAGGH